MDKSLVSRIVLCLFLAIGLPSGAIVAQPAVVLTANYDARLTVAGAKFHVTSQAKVRNGRTFPIDFQDHRIDVTISTLGDGKYRAYVNVFERHDNDWRKVTRDELEFEAAFAAPIQFEWAEGELSMDVAIAVSISKT